MYNTLKLYDSIVINYYKTLLYLKNKLNSEVIEYSKQKELQKVVDMLENGGDKE